MTTGDREALKRAFLADNGLADAARARLPGDASTRSYERLTTPAGASLMLMDAPPAAESPPCGPGATAAERAAAGFNALYRVSACRVDAFAATAAYLRGRGYSAPRVIAGDVGEGLAVMEDLGDALFARETEAGADPLPLYQGAVDTLINLHQHKPPAILPSEIGDWPLLSYDDLALKTAASLFIDWWPRHAGGEAFSPDALAKWEALWAPIRARGEAGASVFVHRDYHAENLIWLPERQGLARVGLLDFQDALLGHPAWDLFSLLQDARREVPAELEIAMVERYLAARPDLDSDAFLTDYAGLAALNAARILGIFARLIERDGKPRYAAFIPRMRRMMARNLARPGLEGLRAWFAAHAPMEDAA